VILYLSQIVVSPDETTTIGYSEQTKHLQTADKSKALRQSSPEHTERS
jgi:hypothetical protein